MLMMIMIMMMVRCCEGCENVFEEMEKRCEHVVRMMRERFMCGSNMQPAVKVVDSTPGHPAQNMLLGFVSTSFEAFEREDLGVPET